VAKADLASAVIVQCGLERDLTLFEAGDRTEVGEKVRWDVCGTNRP
jgi:hypothetical protein